MISAVQEAKSSRGNRSRPRASENGDFGLLWREEVSNISDMFNTPTTLLQRVRNVEDSKSWGEFVALYEPLLLSYVRGRLAPETDARDIVQNIFLTLLRVMPTFELDHLRGRFRTWLWRITMNALIDDGRRQRRHKNGRRPWRDDFADIIPDRQGPDKEWLRAYRRRVLEHVLPQVRARTHPKTWLCFDQHLLQGRGCAEVAVNLDITANAVCANAARVFAKVRALCIEYDEEFGDETDELLSGR